DGDGTQDLGEPGLATVVVELVHFGPDGVPGGDDDSFFTTTTDANGNYLFENLPLGEYEVTVTGGITLVDNTDDPDTPGLGDSTSLTTLTAGDPDDLDQDFGYNASSVLGDKVWLDLDGDGVVDPGEPGLAGVEITITSPGIPGGLTTTTNADGDYIFENIPDDDYTISVNPATLPPGVSQTFDFDGVGTPDTSDTTLVDSDLEQDFGYNGAGSIGDTIWLDLDGDGTVNGGETGLDGVTVTLTWDGPAGPVTFTTTTDANGNYLFDNLPDCEITISVHTSTLPAGLSATFDADGGDDSTSDVSLVDGDRTRLDQDFGYNGAGSIGDTVWFDRDGDGVLDPDETGFPNVDVTLVWDSPTGPVTFTTTTDADGEYLFTNLPPGDYTVTVDTGDLPAGLSATFDADGLNDSTSSLTLAQGENNRDQDFGYNGAGSIGDTVFLDLDGDGVQSVGEPGVPGQTVELVWDSPTGPVTYTTTTDADGGYLFPGLPPADYTITVVGGIVDTAENTADPGADGDSTNSITLADGENDLDQDFGYRGVNSIGDTIWYDVDADGTDDGAGTEPRLDGVEVTLTWFGLDGVPGGGDDVTFPVDTTDADGEYLFDGLPDGSYSVTVTDGLPDGIATNSGDPDGGGDSTSIVTDLGVGDANPVADLDQDFGYTGAGTIGDTIWLDLD
ncbi:MAG: SdrD B-like domain-containing protein, partial [Actinomycetota bacterium]